MARTLMNIDLVWSLRSRGLLPTLDTDYEDRRVKMVVETLHSLQIEMDRLDNELRTIYRKRDEGKGCDES